MDKSVIRWNGYCGCQINYGLIHLITIDRKPDNALEIQNVACGDSGKMMKQKLIKGAMDEEQEKEGSLYGTKVSLKVFVPQEHINLIFCVDNQF